MTRIAITMTGRKETGVRVPETVSTVEARVARPPPAAPPSAGGVTPSMAVARAVARRIPPPPIPAVGGKTEGRKRVPTPEPSSPTPKKTSADKAVLAAWSRGRHRLVATRNAVALFGGEETLRAVGATPMRGGVARDTRARRGVMTPPQIPAARTRRATPP